MTEKGLEGRECLGDGGKGLVRPKKAWVVLPHQSAENEHSLNEKEYCHSIPESAFCVCVCVCPPLSISLHYLVLSVSPYPNTSSSVLSLVVWTLWGAKQPGEQHSAATRNMATRAKKRVVKMVTVVLVVFVICWTPLQTLILYGSFSHQDHVSE